MSNWRARGKCTGRVIQQGWVTWEDNRDAARLPRDIRKVKAKLQLDLARGAKKNKQGFYRNFNNFNQKRKTQEV